MLEKLVGLKAVSILQCEEMAKRLGYDSMEFDLCGPKGKNQHDGLMHIWDSSK